MKNSVLMLMMKRGEYLEHFPIYLRMRLMKMEGEEVVVKVGRVVNLLIKISILCQVNVD